MTSRTKLSNRLLSAVLAITVLISMIPLVTLAAPAAGAAVAVKPDTRVTDPSTLDGWKDLFGDPTSGNISTQFAGSVWTDKTVLKDATALGHNGITLDGTDNRSFLVALSAMGSNMTITGKTSAPIDTILVLDVSGSMNNNTGNNDAAEDLVDAANASIAKLFASNPKNRVGVVLYSGSSSSQNNNDAAVSVLPLGAYTTAADNKYLTYTLSGGNEYISLDGDVRVTGTGTRPTTTSKEVVGATYIQKGIYLAMQQFTAANNETTVDGIKRMPVLILMSDGSPTLSSTAFTAPGQYDLGNGQASSTSAAQGFVTQLTASYAKTQIEAKYDQEMLFYTLGFKVDENSVAEYVLNPDAVITDNNTTATAIGDFWDEYRAAAVGGTVKVQSEGRWVWEYGQRVWRETRAWNVTKNAAAMEQAYVTRYFTATNDLTAAFNDIISDSLLKAKFYPTLIRDNEDLSGYVSFVDRIGHHMSVTDIKGILVEGTLFSGADLSSNFATGANGGLLGTTTSPTALGTEMVHAVQKRLGIDDVDTARTLISLAHQYGQLSYTSATEFSNYIGWYANAKGEYLGFWHEGSTTVPEATGNADTDPVYLIKSYGYLGAAHGSDMMYATVQVRKDIATGDETVAFAIPASLIPIISYNVSLSENGALEELTVSGATAPMRLVYEVALDAHIDEISVHDPSLVEPDYLANNTNPDGSVNFYTNAWDADNKIGYGTVNTYSYFNPAKENERYYYTGHSLIYTDTQGTRYTGTAAPATNGVFYREYAVYTKQGTALAATKAYERISEKSLGKAVYSATEGWYIPEGTVHTYTDGFDVYKTENATHTLTETFGTAATADDKGLVYRPFVDVEGHDVNESGYYYYTGATLGNNGLLTVTPATGIEIEKVVGGETPDTDAAFTFTVTSDDANYNATASLRHIDAAGTQTDSQKAFVNGVLTVSLKHGEKVYITGIAANNYTVAEAEHPLYAASVNGTDQSEITLTVDEHVMSNAVFVNTEKQFGNLTITKRVLHSLGDDFVVPSMDFVIETELTLGGAPIANKTFTAVHSGDASITSITTDTNGKFRVALSDNEIFEVIGLQAGTVANGTEYYVDGNTDYTYSANGPWYAGFTAPTYWDEDATANDGQVVVIADATVTAGVFNTYAPNYDVITVPISLFGTKTVTNGSAVDDTFAFLLEQWDGSQWIPKAMTLAKGGQQFNFGGYDFTFDAVGTYTYQVVEKIPAVGDADYNPGITYDRTRHVFSVVIDDTDMDGKLEVLRVESEHVGAGGFSLVGGVWTNNNIHFTNHYQSSDALAELNVQKVLINESHSPLVSLAGFKFELYDSNNQKVAEAVTDATGEAQLLWTIVGANDGDRLTYTLKEVQGISGMIYAADTAVTVEVSDNGVGKKTAAVISPTLTNDGEVEVTNTYAPTAAIASPGVSKILTGRDLVAGEFTFELKQLIFANEPYVQYATANGFATLTADGITATNAAAADGQRAAVLFPNLRFEQVGKYYFTVDELGTDANGVTYDNNVYHILVEVTDTNGVLTLSASIIEQLGADNNVVFKNTYASKSVDYTVTGNKTLLGRVLINDEFTFVLKNTATAETYTANNFVDGHFAFETLTFTAAGEYAYEVWEQQADMGGIVYDQTVYTVTIVVKDNTATGQLYVDTVLVNGQANVDIYFTNQYIAAPVGTKIPGNKILEGKTLGDGDYTFELYRSDAAWTWNENALIETVTNAADGTLAFEKLGKLDAQTGLYVFDKAGSYYYIIAEKNGGEDIDGILYDDTVYFVRIDITDDLVGRLHARVHLFDAQGIPQDGAVFTNIYRITQGATVRLDGTKELVGRPMTANDVFDFELYESDAVGAIGQKLATVQNNGRDFRFEITYDGDDVRTEPYYYVIKEAKAGANENGIAYSTAQYAVKVTVSDNGDGTIKTDVEIVGGTIAFRNVYEASGATRIEGEKTLEGGTLAADQFTFELYAADAQGTTNGTPLTVKNALDGKFAFELSYTQADVRTEPYYYLVREVNGGKFVDQNNGKTAIAHDATQYLVAVTVSDNGDGTLKVTKQIAAVGGNASTDRVRFVNTEKQIVEKEAALSAEPAINIDGRSVSVGEELVYTIRYFNSHDAAADVTLTDTIPNGTAYVDGSATENGTYAGGILTWNLTVAAKATVTVQFKVVVQAAGLDIVNEAKAIVGNNEYTSNEVVNYTYEKTVDKTAAQVGDTLTYNVVYTNDTAAQAVVVIEDALDEGLAYVEGSATHGGVYDATTHTVTWTFAAVNPDETISVGFAATVKKGADDIENTVTILENTHKITTNTVTTEILYPQLAVRKEQALNGGEKTTETLQVAKDDVVTYFITVTNNGDGVAKNVVIADAVPTGLIPDELSITEGGVLQNGTITWNFAELQAGQTKTVSFAVKVPDVSVKTTWTNVATVTAEPGDPTDTNEVTIEQTPPPAPPLPDTGESNEHLFLLLALLFVSGGTIALTARRKKENTH